MSWERRFSLVSPSLHADDFDDDKLTSVFCDHIVSFFPDIQVFLSVSVEGYHDWICSGFISPGSGLCSSAAVRCSRWVGSFLGLSISVLVGFSVGFSLWCCVQAAVWADVASRSPVDRFVAVTTIVMSTESAAKILTMSALLVRLLSSHNENYSVLLIYLFFKFE